MKALLQTILKFLAILFRSAKESSFPPVNEPALIPREVLFNAPAYSSPQMSPDGKYLCFVKYNWVGELPIPNVWVMDISTPSNIDGMTGRQITSEAGGVPAFDWLYDNKTITFRKPDYTTAAIDVETGTERSFGNAQIVAKSRFQPLQVVTKVSDPAKPFPVFYQMNTQDMSQELLFENDRFNDMRFDHSLQPKLGVTMTEDNVSWYVKNGDDWTLFKSYTSIDEVLYDYFLQFDITGQFVYWRNSTGPAFDKGALMQVSLPDKSSSQVLFLPTRGDFLSKDVLYDRRSEKPVMVSTNYGRQERHILDTSINPDVEILERYLQETS